MQKKMLGLGLALTLGLGSAPSLASTPALRAVNLTHVAKPGTSSEYVYVADRTQEELVVYPARVQNPSPIRTVKTGIVEIGGVAVDSGGIVYVANGSAGTVLEYSPGATSLLRTLSIGLHHPVNVTTGINGNIYVADANPGAPSVVVYGPTGLSPIQTILTPDGKQTYTRGIAVDAAGDVFVETLAGSQDPWPIKNGQCGAVSHTYEYFVGSNSPVQVLLQADPNPFGLALDSGANLFDSDWCTNTVSVANPPSYETATPFPVSDSYFVPSYITISSDQLLAIANGGFGSYGNAVIEDIKGGTPPVTISKGLEGVIGVAIGFGP